MRKLAKYVLLSTAALMVATVAWANPVAERKELMKSAGKAMKLSVMMQQGKIPYNAARAEQAMKQIVTVADKFGSLLPKGSDADNALMEYDTESTASPKIWTNMREFQLRLKKLKVSAAAAAKAARAGEGAFKAAIGRVGKNCKSCHESFRIKK